MLELTVRLVASLAVVVGLMLLLARLAGRRFRSAGGAAVRVVHRQPLTRGSALTVVEVGGRVLVLGTTDSQVNVLAELDPADLADETALAEVAGVTEPAALAAPAHVDEPETDEEVDEEVEPDLLDAPYDAEPADQEVLELPAGLPSLVPAHLAAAPVVAATPVIAPVAATPVAAAPRGRRCADVPVDSVPVLGPVGRRAAAPATAHPAAPGRRMAPVAAPVATPVAVPTPAAVPEPVRAAAARPALTLDDFLASKGLSPETVRALTATPAKGATSRTQARAQTRSESRTHARPGAPATGPLAGSVLSPQTWRQALAAVSRRAS